VQRIGPPASHRALLRRLLEPQLPRAPELKDPQGVLLLVKMTGLNLETTELVADSVAQREHIRMDLSKARLEASPPFPYATRALADSGVGMRLTIDLVSRRDGRVLNVCDALASSVHMCTGSQHSPLDPDARTMVEEGGSDGWLFEWDQLWTPDRRPLHPLIHTSAALYVAGADLSGIREDDNNFYALAVSQCTAANAALKPRELLVELQASTESRQGSNPLRAPVERRLTTEDLIDVIGQSLLADRYLMARRGEQRA
jgi:hypothetical protein